MQCYQHQKPPPEHSFPKLILASLSGYLHSAESAWFCALSSNTCLWPFQIYEMIILEIQRLQKVRVQALHGSLTPELRNSYRETPAKLNGHVMDGIPTMVLGSLSAHSAEQSANSKADTAARMLLVRHNTRPDIFRFVQGCLGYTRAGLPCAVDRDGLSTPVRSMFAVSTSRFDLPSGASHGLNKAFAGATPLHELHTPKVPAPPRLRLPSPTRKSAKITAFSGGGSAFLHFAVQALPRLAWVPPGIA